MLLAKSFNAEGYEVYFFESAQQIPRGASLAFKFLFQDQTKKVAVLIDEAGTDPDSELLITILKGSYRHLVNIGSAVVPPLLLWNRLWT
jgi:hypothetical protein